MKKVVIYARYSSDLQRETSIDDQVRRCQEVAERAGFVDCEFKVFEDQALSGMEKHLHKREGFTSLLSAWDQGRIDVLLVDEVSRLSRDGVELAKLGKRIEDTGVRLLTADGLDSAQQGWQLLFGMTSIVSQQAVRDTSHRVTRGMLGQLERGFMIALPPYGYEAAPCCDHKGYRIGTYWNVHPDEAKVVTRIFTLRSQGMALGQIARTLNDEGILPSRKRKNAGSFWRPATIRRLLSNSIYRGVFVWHGSPNVRARAMQRRQEIGEREFARPDLKIIDDELWRACNRSVISRSGYGGGVHAFSGLVSCGTCSATMSVSTGGSSHTLACASCGMARRVGANSLGRGTLSVTGLKHALEDAIRALFTKPVIAEFHSRLNAKLNQGIDEELCAANIELERLKRVRDRMTRVLRIVDADDDALIKEYQLARDAYLQQENRVNTLKNRITRINKDDLARQSAVDPKKLISQLWSTEMKSERLRSLLTGLFSEIVFEGRVGRFEAQVRITVSPGVVAAILTNTGLIDETTVTWRYTIRAGSSRPTKWHVERQRVQSTDEGQESELPHQLPEAG